MDQYEQGSLPPLWSDWPYLLHLLVGDPRSQQSGIVKSGRLKLKDKSQLSFHIIYYQKNISRVFRQRQLWIVNY